MAAWLGYHLFNQIQLFMKMMLLRSSLLLFTLLLLATGCQQDEEPTPTPTIQYAADVPVAYFDLAIKLTKETPGFSPPVAARAYGYTAVTLYQSVVGGLDGYQSLEGQINGLSVGDIPEMEEGKTYNLEIVANSALAGIMKELYRKATADNLQALADLEASNYASLSVDLEAEVAERSKAYGEAVAAAMYEYAKSDGQDECYLNNFPVDYVPPVGDGAWVPTPPAFSRALQPYWGDVRPFLMANVTETQPNGHPQFSTETDSDFFAEAAEVYVTASNLTPEQETIANFWSDDPGKTGTPPGHSISVLTQVLRQEDADLATAAEAYAKVGMSVHDAFISCWKCKYTFSLMRPITYIQQYIAPSWTTLLSTPPFPEYTSGHSVQAGATAQVLTDIFGENYSFIDRTHEARTDINGSPRSFDSFFEMADEAAISRLYGGIHYKAAIQDGVVQGRKIGKNVSELVFKN